MTKMLPPFFECKIEYLALSAIIGIDPDFQELLDELNLNLPPSIRITDWPSSILIALLHSHPIAVRKRAAKYQCIGGFRQYKLAQSMPDHEKMIIPVVVFPTKLSGLKKMALLAAELFLPSAIFRLRNGDARILDKAFSKLEAKFPDLQNMDFGKAMQFDPRSYGQKREHKKDT